MKRIDLSEVVNEQIFHEKFIQLQDYERIVALIKFFLEKEIDPFVSDLKVSEDVARDFEIIKNVLKCPNYSPTKYFKADFLNTLLENAVENV